MSSYNLCGCWFPVPGQYGGAERQYLPQVQLESHTNILSTTSRTTLKQVFINPRADKLAEVQYTFPLYDGVSVVGFKCTVASKVLVGIVKEKQQARKDYQKAVNRGETASLLEQIPEASDTFTTKVGNIPAGDKVHIEIIYLGELKHDAETDGSRFTIPTIIAPRYGPISHESASAFSPSAVNDGGIKILVDVALDQSSIIRGMQSPSHPIAVTMGRTSSMEEDVFDNTHASATLTLGKTELDKDFIIVVQSKEQGTPRALLETHPSILNQRALMATLVPKFNLPNIAPEIVFVVDRSGSMGGKISTLISALKIFLKSLPANGTKFNICSFGSRYEFLFTKSKTYDESSLKEAIAYIATFDANFGGTEMLDPFKATCKNRFDDMPLEVMVLTDGQIWNQDKTFEYINEQKNTRFFSLGIGSGASSALVEGVARAGGGFAQFVGDNEKMDKRIVRMLKGALTPHISDYRLDVQYQDDNDDDYEMVESVTESMQTVVGDLPKSPSMGKKVISLFDRSTKEQPTNPKDADRFSSLPTLAVPKILQAPCQIPALYPFNRTSVFLLLSPDAPQKTLKSVKLRGTSDHGPLELEIPVQHIGRGETLHQLATKKAVHELEQNRGWITDLKADNKPLKTKYEGRWDLMVERECVRLGVQFQVGGKYCSFVAVEKKDKDALEDDKVEESYETPAKETNFEPEFAVARARRAPSFGFKSMAHNLGLGGSGGKAGAPATVMAATPPPGAQPFLRQSAMLGGTTMQPGPPPPPALNEAYTPVVPQMVGFSAHTPLFNKFSEPASQVPVTEAVPAPIGSSGASQGVDYRRRAVRRVTDSKVKRSAPVTSTANESVAGYSSLDMDTQTEDFTETSDLQPQKQLSDEDKMHMIIEMQEFDGSWKSTDALFNLVSVGKADIKTGVDDKVQSTALAIAWLETKMKSEEDVWEMVVEKAKSWLEGVVGSAEIEKVLSQTKGILGI